MADLTKQPLTPKYEQRGTAIAATLKPDPRDKLELEIGDSKQADFYPQVKLMRWQDETGTNEANVSIRYQPDAQQPKRLAGKLQRLATPHVTSTGSRVSWKQGNTEARFYEIEPNDEHPEGAHEFDVVLTEAPESNVLTFTIQTKGVSFYYQPELTAEEIEQGNERPENVVGSYAIYADKQGDYSKVGGNNYRSGKVGHIYRPKVADSAGNEVWGELHVDEDAGELTVTVPQEFLDSAVYPVVVDPTLGYTTAGSSSIFNGSGQVGAMSGVLPTDASVSSITTYISNFATYGVKSLMFNSNGSLIPGSVTSEAMEPSGASWRTHTLSSPLSLGSGTYYFGAILSNINSSIRYDSGTYYDGLTDYANSYASPGDSLETESSVTLRKYKVSSYITYSEVTSSRKLVDYVPFSHRSSHAYIDGSAQFNGISISQSFQTGVDDVVLNSIESPLKASSTSSNIQAEIYAHSGTYGTSSVPTGAALATSDTVLVTSSATNDVVKFTFSGADKITLSSNTYYCLVLTNTGSSNVEISLDTENYHAGNSARYKTSWTTSSGDMLFALYADSDDSGGPTPTAPQVKLSGSFVPATAKVKVGGEWVAATVKHKVDGEWV